MDPSNLTWSKPSKLIYSMSLSMPLYWTMSLAHLEHVMGPYWCLSTDIHHPLDTPMAPSNLT